MKIQTFVHWCSVPTIILSFLVSACTPGLNAGIAMPAGSQPDKEITSELKSNSPNSNVPGTNINQTGEGLPIPEGMVLFEGSVFVASTEPDINRWQLAGWLVSSKPFKDNGGQPPQDCTLYPHKGVENQWIGNCFGTTLIPEDGAQHIAVMHTALDGSTTLIQVAPSPDITGQ